GRAVFFLKNHPSMLYFLSRQLIHPAPRLRGGGWGCGSCTSQGPITAILCRSFYKYLVRHECDRFHRYDRVSN
ncbi:MAG: hypothetical protein V7K26_05300, partial [Nostoc sp.]|uniref:hypothetical protein n=1 Tax=Nostoc sp. TaxID=1180 RepID=UPI002FF1AF6A